MSIRSKRLLLVISALFASVLLQSTQYLVVVDSAPIIPILTAIASSVAGIFSIQVDTLHIAKYLRESANCKKNRGAFVRDLLYTAFYRSGQTHNVIVFNLGEEHHQRLYGVLFYGSVNYVDGTRFGVWVFESGVFSNKGARGWQNWGMIGSFSKSTEGETIYFQRRHKPPTSTSTTLATSILTVAYESNDTSTTTASATDTTENPSTIISTTATPSIISSRTTVNPADILLGFNEVRDVSSLMENNVDPLKKFIDEKNEDTVVGDAKDEGGGGGGRREKPIKIDVNVNKPNAKENDEKSRDNKKQKTSPKAKRANSLSKTGKSKNLDV